MGSNQEINKKKSKFQDEYNAEDPSFYFDSLCMKSKYLLPEYTKFYFKKIIDFYFEIEPVRNLKILDLGCSFGINSAIVKYNKTIEELYQHYTNPSRLVLSKKLRTQFDRNWFNQSTSDHRLKFVGVDISELAIKYSIDTGLIQDGISTNLENFPLLEDDYVKLKDVNLMISTGCIGYATEITLGRLLSGINSLDNFLGAIFVFRAFDFSSFTDILKSYCLTFISTGILVKQRKFSSSEEQENMVSLIERRGLSAKPEKMSCWLFAELFLIVPDSEFKVGKAVELATRLELNLTSKNDVKLIN